MAIMIKVSGNTPAKSVSLEGRNLEQLRAVNALAAAPKIGLGKEGGRSVAKKVPAQIVQNGFLGALAFAIESAGTETPGEDDYVKNGYANTFIAIMKHLKSIGRDLGICDNGLRGFIDGLGSKSASELRMVTEEVLCYLNYLRRFAKPKMDDANKGGEL